MTTPSKRADRLADDQAVIAATQKFFAPNATLPVGNKQMLPAAIVQVFQDRIDKAQAAIAAGVAKTAAVNADRDEQVLTDPFVRTFIRFVQAAFAGAPDTLAAFHVEGSQGPPRDRGGQGASRDQGRGQAQGSEGSEGSDRRDGGNARPGIAAQADGLEHRALQQGGNHRAEARPPGCGGGGVRRTPSPRSTTGCGSPHHDPERHRAEGPLVVDERHHAVDEGLEVGREAAQGDALGRRRHRLRGAVGRPSSASASSRPEVSPATRPARRRAARRACAPGRWPPSSPPISSTSPRVCPRDR